MAATIKDIASRTGLSIATISKYINGGNVLEKNRAAIDAAIEALDFSVNEVARNLKTKRSGYVGLLLPALNNGFMMEIINVMQLMLRERGYGVVLCCIASGSDGDSKEEERKAARFLLQKGVDGIINLPMDEDGAHLLDALEANIPITLIDKQITALADRVNAVVIDNVGACRLAADELLNAGHRRIAALFGAQDNYTARRRYEGYVDACLQRGFEPDKRDVVFAERYNKEGGYAAMRSVIGSDVTAVLATNSGITLGALRVLAEEGISIPAEMSVVGFDGIGHMPGLTVTSVLQPTEEIGAAAAQIMYDSLQAVAQGRAFVPQLRTLGATLVRGNSVRTL